MPRKFGIRDVGILLHRWTGLLIAAFLLIVALTGSILAFEDKLDHWLNPELHVSHPPNRAPLDLATFAERAEASDPRLRVNYFWVEEDQVHVVVNGRTDPSTGKPFELGYSELILDPWRGAILGKSVMEGQWRDPGPWQTRVLPFVYSLHTSLATGTSTGWTFMGVIALLWTLDCFVAFYVTLPRGADSFWQRWKQDWSVKWTANPMRVHFDLHRAGGLWLWPLLFIFGWSSVMFGLPQVYEPVMKDLFDYNSMSEQIARNSVAKPLDKPALNWRQAQQAGERAIAEQASLYHFTVRRPYGMAYIADYGAYTYSVRSSIDFRGHGWDTSVLVDGNTGQLRSVDLARGQHLGNSIFNLLWGIHFADLRDWLPYRILVCLFGLFLSVISYTGVYIWWKKRKTRQLARSRARALAQEPDRVRLVTTLTKSKSMLLVLLLVVHVSFLVAHGQDARAQTPQLALHSKIVDPSGAVLTGATVTIKNSDGISLGTLRTDDQRAFSFTAPKPGGYLIEVSHTGFEKRPHASSLGWIPPGMARKNKVCQGERLRVSQCQAERQKAALRVRYGAEIFAPRGSQRRRDARGLEGTLRLSQLSPFAGNCTGEVESRSKNCPRCAASRGLRHNDGTVCAVRHGIYAGCARQVLGTVNGRQNPPSHGASSVRIMGWIVGWNFGSVLLSSLERWWPGTELNRRRQPFQGCSRPQLSVDSARHSLDNLPDFVLFIGAKMEPSCTNLSLPRFASIRHGFQLARHKVRFH